MLVSIARVFVALHVLLQTTDTTVLADNESTSNGNESRLISELVRWLVKNGATINHKLEIRRVDAGDPTSPRGVFATEGMAAGEMVCSIPTDVIIKPEKTEAEEGGEDWDCGTIAATIDAMSGVDATPYGEYLLAQPRSYIPGFWSKEGKRFFRSMLDRRLPPQGFDELLDGEFRDYCGGDVDNPLHVHAKMMVTARADFQFMIPFYDMINHDNGKYNVKHSFLNSEVVAEKRVEILAAKPIEAGQQLYNSYNRCNICDYYYDWFGTPQMLANYGFVETMPQRWLFDFARVKFELDWKNGEESTNKLEATFLVPPSAAGMTALESELRRLRGFAGDGGRDFGEERSIPKREWDTAWRYHDALVVALSAAIGGTTELRDDVWSMGDHWWVQEGPDDQMEEWYVDYHDVGPSSIETCGADVPN